MLRIGIILDSDMEKRFKAIQRRLGIQSHSDIIRFLINEKYQQIAPEIQVKA